MLILTQRERELIEELLDISKKIWEKYEEISLIEGQSAEIPLSKQEELATLLKKEESIYNEVLKNPSMINSINRYINKINDDEEDFDIRITKEFPIIESLDAEEIIKMRISNRLLGILNNNDLATFSDEENNHYQSKLLIAILDDYVNTVLTILYLYLNNNKYNIIKDRLLKVKYAFICMHQKSENLVLKNSLLLSDNVYWDAPLISQVYNISEEERKELYETIANEIFDEKIADIIATDDDELEEAPSLFQYTLSKILIRSSLLFMGEEVVKKLQKNFKINVYNDGVIVEGERLTDIANRAQHRVDTLLEAFYSDIDLVKKENITICKKEDTNADLTKEEYEMLEELLTVSKSIKDIYDVLASLELEGKKETPLYKEKEENLKKLLNDENTLYIKISQKISTIVNMLYYISNYTPYDEADILQIIKENSEDEIIKMRIYLRLDFIFTTAKFDNSLDTVEEVEKLSDTSLEDLSEEELDYFTNLSEEEIAKKDAELRYETYLSDMINCDILNTILTILNDYIYKDEYASIRDLLTFFKYSISYIYASVEDDLIANNFNINPILYWRSKLYIRSSEDANFYNQLISNKSLSILLEQIEPLISTFYNDFSDNNYYFATIITQIIIRSCLLFANFPTTKKFLEVLTSEIASVKENGDGKKEADEFIKETFAYLENDRLLPQKLEFNLN